MIRFLRTALFLTIVGIVPLSTGSAAGAGSPEAATPPPAAAIQKIDYDESTGRLAVEAADADLGELLGAIARKGGMTIELGAGITKKVSVSFAGLPLEEGINAIVAAAGEGNLAAEYTKRPGGADAYRLEKIVVLRKGKDAAAAVKAAGGGAQARRDGPTLEELVRRYGDPKATPDEKLKLRRSIRRGARTPAEKAQLKRAVLDPRNQGEIGRDLQAALLQSMREHPEKSDKPYILDLMRREPSPGLLVRAMVGGGDPAYVNYLVSAAREQDLRAIELIGNLGLKQAAPVLEQLAAAQGLGSPAREAAETALRRLGAAPADRAGRVRGQGERLKK